ncbi:MAG TPA: ABC transporter permease [Actinomycetaceae bacterium]|nr:ABC transporter permease [Actinomycetaceae bacterium]
MSGRAFRSDYSGNARAVVERGFKVILTQNWIILVSGFFEPLLYLFAMGYGLGGLIGTVEGPGGVQIPYVQFIAPALLATSAMNGAIYDSTWNVFFKMRFAKIYQAMVSTSLGPMDVALGEIFMALFRGFLYAIGFMAVLYGLGIISGPQPLLMVPAAVLIAFGFASFGMGVTSFMSTFQQMDIINFVLLPMFMLSGTLFPIEILPEWGQLAVMMLPLWHGIELMRQLAAGVFTSMTPVHVAYFLVMVALGIWFTTVRLRKLFLR